MKQISVTLRLAVRSRLFARSMAISNVLVVSVPVFDTERARTFYVETLGLELRRDDSSIPGMRWAQVAPAGSAVSLTLVTWFETITPGSLWGLVLTSTDLQAGYDTLVAKGVEFEGPPQRQPWATEAVFHDPDGSGIVQQA